MFGSGDNKSNASNPPHKSNAGGGIDYEKLRRIITEAIMRASGSNVDINRNKQ